MQSLISFNKVLNYSCTLWLHTVCVDRLQCEVMEQH